MKTIRWNATTARGLALGGVASALGLALACSGGDPAAENAGALSSSDGGGGAGDATQVDAVAKDASGDGGKVCAPAIDRFKELEIVHPNVVGDPARTSGGGSGADAGAVGHWSLRFLLEEMAPTGVNPGDFFLNLLESWDSTHTINGEPIESRPAIDNLVICPWLTASGCTAACGTCKTNGTHLDLSKAPFELMGIIDRLDLHGTDCKSAGEGRFVFAVEQFGTKNLQPFTMIFEYHLPVNGTTLTRLAWAKKWHALHGLTLGSEAYNAALQGITDLFATRGADPSLPNGSAISQIRSNEIALSIPWQLREFNMAVNDAGQGMMEIATTKQSMNQQLNNTVFLHDFIVKNAKAINNGTIVIDGGLLGGESNEGVDPWMTRDPVDGGISKKTLQNFGMLSCNGCHKDNKSFDDQSSTFYHISPELPPGTDGTGRLSVFLLGDLNDAGVAPDGGVGAGDLARRADELQEILCGTSCEADGGVLQLAPENARVE